MAAADISCSARRYCLPVRDIHPGLRPHPFSPACSQTYARCGVALALARPAYSAAAPMVCARCCVRPPALLCVRSRRCHAWRARAVGARGRCPSAAPRSATQPATPSRSRARRGVPRTCQGHSSRARMESSVSRGASLVRPTVRPSPARYSWVSRGLLLAACSTVCGLACSCLRGCGPPLPSPRPIAGCEPSGGNGGGGGGGGGGPSAGAACPYALLPSLPRGLWSLTLRWNGAIPSGSTVPAVCSADTTMVSAGTGTRPI